MYTNLQDGTELCTIKNKTFPRFISIIDKNTRYGKR